MEDDLRRWTITLDQAAAELPRPPRIRRCIIIGPGGVGSLTVQPTNLPAASRPVRLAPDRYDALLTSLAQAGLEGEWECLEPTPPEAPTFTIEVERDGAVRTRIAGPVRPDQRSRLDGVIGALEEAVDPAAPFRDMGMMSVDVREWTVMVSPAFPEEGCLVRYAYAWRYDLESFSGIEVAQPFARGIEDAAGNLRIEALTPGIALLDVQGVRPMTAEELTFAARELEIESRLRADPGAPPDALIRGFFCAWRDTNGIVARDIMPRHPEFSSALNCWP